MVTVGDAGDSSRWARFHCEQRFIAQLLYDALVDGGLEFRGQIMRLVRTLRGGDRPKNAEAEFPGVSSMPKGCYEPWGLFRRPLPNKMTVAQCLREYQTGALRRTFDDKPFEDIIPSERTPRRERDIVDHPSLKPQSFMRQLCYAALPLGEGVIVDPFAGSGSTIAAAEALGLCGIGIERHPVETKEFILMPDRSSSLPFCRNRFASRSR